MRSRDRDFLIALALVVPVTAIAFVFFALFGEIVYGFIHG